MPKLEILIENDSERGKKDIIENEVPDEVSSDEDELQEEFKKEIKEIKLCMLQLIEQLENVENVIEVDKIENIEEIKKLKLRMLQLIGQLKNVEKVIEIDKIENIERIEVENEIKKLKEPEGKDKKKILKRIKQENDW